MRAGLTLLVLVPMLTGCYHKDQDKKDTGNFDKRLACSELSYGGHWEDLPDGPFLDSTYYSSSLDTCIFVLKRTHRGEKDGGIHIEATITDALTRKPIWVNDPEKGETDDQVTADINQQLKTMQITP